MQLPSETDVAHTLVDGRHIAAGRTYLHVEDNGAWRVLGPSAKPNNRGYWAATTVRRTENMTTARPKARALIREVRRQYEVKHGAQENPFSENPSPLSWLLIAGAIGGLGYAAYYFHNVAQINAQADKLSLPHVGASAMVGTMTAKTDASGNVTFSYTDPTSNQATTVVAPIASLQLYNGQYTSNVPSVQAQMNNLPNVPTAQNNFSTGASGLPQLAAGA